VAGCLAEDEEEEEIQISETCLTIHLDAEVPVLFTMVPERTNSLRH
jgi:hypothetical protein